MTDRKNVQGDERAASEFLSTGRTLRAANGLISSVDLPPAARLVLTRTVGELVVELKRQQADERAHDEAEAHAYEAELVRLAKAADEGVERARAESKVPAGPGRELGRDADVPWGANVPKSSGRRRNLLDPVIESVQRECADRWDAAEVFAKLCMLAREKHPRAPLWGVTEDGLQWVDGKDEIRILTLDALRERLRRQCERTR